MKYDPEGSPIEISADIGRRDSSTWWFWQPKMGGYSIIDYDGGWGIDAEAWVDRLKKKIGKRKLGKIWLPHDARAKTFAAKNSALEIFIKGFGAGKVAITPNSKKTDRINAARTLIKQVEFNEIACEKGLNGLRAWSYEYNEELKTFSSDPKHDWASHDGDGFSYGCLVMKQTQPVLKPPPMKTIHEITLNEIWEDNKKGRARI